jgi:hypothetical protein
MRERHVINLKREEKAAKAQSQFVIKLQNRTDIATYLDKYSEFMLYNLTDNAYIQVFASFFITFQAKPKNQTKKLLSIKDNWKNEKNALKNGDKTLARKTLIKGSKFIAPRKSEESMKKKEIYYPPLSNYIKINLIQNTNPNAMKNTYSLANQVLFSSILTKKYQTTMQDYNDIAEIWHILYRQLETFENVKQAQPWSRDGDVSEVMYFADSLVKTSCAILEEEFYLVHLS